VVRPVTGPLDLAGDVRGESPPAWLRGRLERGLDRLGAVPDRTGAVRAVARRHDRDPAEVLLTAGDDEAFVLLARALRPRRALCVHPGPRGPEDALRAAGRPVDRLVLEPPFVLDPADVPEAADLVVVGSPADPTGVVHQGLDWLCRDGRVVVVDESHADAVPDEPHSLAARSDLPGLVVVRSLTRTWALSGLPVGYLLAPPELVQRLRAAQPPSAVSSLALVALETCLARGPVATAQRDARELAAERERLAAALSGLGVQVTPGSQAPFLLCRVPGRSDVRELLLGRGIAVHPGESYPGLGSEHWRVAVRGEQESGSLVAALGEVLSAGG